MLNYIRKTLCRRVKTLLIGTVAIYVVLLMILASTRLPHGTKGIKKVHNTPSSGIRIIKRVPLNQKKAIELYNAARKKIKPKDCVKPVFFGQPLPKVALASFPGSGNTWVRHLVQQATGIVTGSQYRDMGLSFGGMVGEGYNGSNAIMIKTHEFGWDARRDFDKAVLLIRNPYEAMLSEFHRRHGGHLGHARAQHFTEGKLWSDYVGEQAKKWLMFNMDWLHLFEKPLLLLTYSDIKQNTRGSLELLMNFLDASLTEDRLRCVIEASEGRFKRYPRKVIDFDPYNREMRTVIDAYWNITNIAIKVREPNMKSSAPDGA